MKKSKRMRKLSAIAHHKEERELIQLAETQRNQLQAQSQLEKLQVYLKEYQEQLHQIGQGGISSNGWAQRHAFLKQLIKMTEQQILQVKQAEASVEAARKSWLIAHQRQQSLEKAHDIFKEEEDWHEFKLDEKAMDAIAGRLSSNKHYK